MTSGQLPALQPVVNPETKVFWDSLSQGRFVMPKCDSCGLYIWYPRLHCPRCHGAECSWTEVSGKGIIYSFSVVRRTASEEFAPAVPYVLAYVELDEGPRVYTNIINVDANAVRIGQRVAIDLSLSANGIALPRFQPISGDLNG